MWLREVAKIVEAAYVGADRRLSGVSIDSRSIEQGALFIAIKGEARDGHDFVQTAVERGASALLVSDPIAHATCPVLQVQDTVAALAKLAEAQRKELTATTVFGVTGSCGKTTIKNILTHILKQKGSVLASKKSFNNRLGVPLTLLETQALPDYLVAEIGTNSPGEIASLSQLVRPHIACISNAAETHLSGLGSVEGVAQEKAALFIQLEASHFAIINGEDPHAHYWMQCAAPAKCITFGLQETAMVYAKNITLSQAEGLHFDLCIAEASIPITLALWGRHNIMNALAAAAMATAAGCTLEVIKQGIEETTASFGRLRLLTGPGNSILIDDTYNANPHSVRAAIVALSEQFSAGRKTILVLGDMLELGSHSVALHAEVGECAKQHGIDCVLSYGDVARHTSEALGVEGQHFTEKCALVQALVEKMRETECAVLVKGSRGLSMDTVVKQLIRV